MMAGAVSWVLRRDLKTAYRRRAEVLTTLVFFVIVVSLYPLGVGPEPQLLRSMGPGVVWVAALLATMLGLPRMFGADHADGTLEQLALAPRPLGLLVAAKIGAHWIVSGLPLVIVAPVLGLQYDLPPDALVTLVVSLLIGTPSLSLVGAVGAALTLGVRGGGALVSLLVLPLFVPILIFGAGATYATVIGMPYAGHLALLAAFLAVALVFAPLAAAAALRIALD